MSYSVIPAQMIISGATAPTQRNVLWKKTSDGLLYYYDGSEWKETGGTIVDDVTITQNESDELEVKDGGISFSKLSSECKLSSSVVAGRNLLDDSFSDNLLTSRTATMTIQDHAIVDTFMGATNYLLAEDQTISCPAWTTGSGSPTASSNAMHLDSGDAVYTSLAGLTYGSHSFTFQYAGVPSDQNLNIDIFKEDSANLYRYHCGNYSAKKGTLVKVIAGSETQLIAGDPITDTDEHTVKIVRASDGSWELFLDDVSQGTASDSSSTTPTTIYMAGNSSNDVAIKNIKVTT